MVLSENVRQFLEKDNAKIDELIAANPVNLSVTSIAAFLELDAASVRSAIENDVFGIAWRKSGNARHGYFIPTAQFIRWYLKL